MAGVPFLPRRHSGLRRNDGKRDSGFHRAATGILGHLFSARFYHFGGLFPTPLYHLGRLFQTRLYRLHPCRRTSL